MREILHIGRIGAPHGLRGEVKVQPLTDDPSRFNELDECFIVSENEKNRTPARAQGVRFLNDQVLLKFAGFDDRDAAIKIRGYYVSVDRAHAVVLPEDTWFICDLLGCEVYDEIHGSLGFLKDVIQNSAHDVYLVRKSGQADILIPVLKTVVKEVDIDNRRIEVVLPDGLFEIYRQGEE